MVERSSSRPQTTTNYFYYESDIGSSTSVNSDISDSSGELFAGKGQNKARTIPPTKGTPTKVVENRETVLRFNL